jgi:dihydrofolate synthase/folylpolyglutamate synthase
MPAGIGASFFEVTTAAAFLAFSRTPADACVIEVGLGGRLDATNVIAQPADVRHRAARARPPILPRRYDRGDRRREGRDRQAPACRWLPSITRVAGRSVSAWHARPAHAGCPRAVPGMPRSSRQAPLSRRAGELELPLPRLAGAHQAANAGLAFAMLRHQDALEIPASALRAAMGWAEWPARLQRLSSGPVRSRFCPNGSELWLDGGHNPAGARAIAEFFRARVAPGRPFHILMGLLANKDLRGFLEPFAGWRARCALPGAGP